MKTKIYFLCLSLVLAVAGLVACDKASPVAPAGTVLSVTANPTQIPATGTAQVRVVALRANGTPVNPGTQIRMSTSLGTIDPLVEVGDGGVAVGTLQGDGRIGTATVTASVGAETTATVEVAVGKPAANISLQATPPQVEKTTGGTIQLVAVVRDDTGEPLSDAAVNFQTEVGILRSGGSVRRTDSGGEVRDILTIREEDLASFNGNSFDVRAIVGSGASTESDTARIQISTCAPVVSFELEKAGSLKLQVAENDTSGDEPMTLLWDKETDGVIDEDFTNQRQPIFEYTTGGPKTVTLRAENDCGFDVGTRTLEADN